MQSFLTGTITLSAVTLACAMTASAASDWTPAPAPLMTRWAADVDPAAPLPEYPRPLLRREQWQNLNGLWDFGMADQDETFAAAPENDALTRKILVPFPVESALSGIGERVESGRAWYRRTFDVPADWTADDGRVLLHFGAVDWEAHVYINGQSVGTHKGGFDPFSFDITDALKAGENEVAVGVFDPSDAGTQPRGKQIRNPHGIWYTPVTGIWQTVWLEPVPANHIRGLKIATYAQEGEIEVHIDATGGSQAPGGNAFDVTVRDGDKVILSQTGRNGSVRLAVPDAKLWSPSSPHLYDVTVRFKNDEVQSYFGLRDVALTRGEDGKVQSISLNGQPLFQVGPLDQGWWPDGLYTAPTDEALRSDIEITKELGFNMIRKHVKVEPARWYYWADTLGILVWQDMPSPIQTDSNMFVRPNQATDPELPEDVKEQFETELREMIADFGNHPSIIMWVVFNEGWGQHDVQRLTELTKALDPSRLASNASGWEDRGAGDVVDMHAYPGPGMLPTEENRVSVLGEFGGLGLPIQGHLWQADRNWGYRGVVDSEELTAGYEDLLRNVWTLRQQGLAAAVYTQTTDVEGEVNGLLTYDRAVIKVDVDRVRAANEGRIDLLKTTPVVPVAQTQGESPMWRYTFEAPKDDWISPHFDDSGWQTGPAGFGAKGTPGARVGTTWDGEEIWLRRVIELDAEAINNIALQIHHDEDAQILINGDLVAELKGYTSDYIIVPLDELTASVLKPGKNTIAVHCRQTQGGQYIDVGFVHLERSPNPAIREDAVRGE